MRQIVFKRFQSGIEKIVCFNIYTHRSYTTRTQAGDKIVELNEETLTGRFLTYLNSNKTKLNEFRNEEIDMLSKLKRNTAHNLQYCSTEEVRNLLLLAKDPNFITKKWEFIKVFAALDLECSNRLEKLQPKTILDFLNIYMQIIPNRIVECTFYQLGIDHLSANIENLTKSELVQFIFYAGLRKRDKRTQGIIKSCLKHLKKETIQELSCEELCIICNATFKTSTKVTNKHFLNKVKNYLNDNLNLLKDPAVFITLIKTIRHNHYEDDNLLSTISCTIFFNKTMECYSFAAMCHILALYADWLYYEEELLKHFCNKCIEELKNFELNHKYTYITRYIRDKDIKRFLWSLSTLGYGEVDCDVVQNTIIPKIVERITEGELSKDPESLVEMMLYLWMMNYQAVELVPYIFTNKNIARIRENKTRAKDRLNLLLNVIYFENKPLFKEINTKPQGNPMFNRDVHVERRPVLTRVFENLKALQSKNELNKFEINFQIPYLNIAGITGYRKNIYKAIYLEVLDDYVCVKNCDYKPSGPMKLKLRILQRFEEALIVIRQDEIEDMTEKELQVFLIEELELVC